MDTLRKNVHLYVALVALTAACQAQAPIVREPPPPVEWTVFVETVPDFAGSEIAVKTDRHTVHCDLRHADAGTLFCYPRYPFPLLFPPNMPNEAVPRQHIVAVQRVDRPASALVGFAVGFGFGTAAYAANHSDYSSQDIVYLGVLSGVIGALIGHTIPLVHHTLYRAPQHLN